MRWTHLSLAGSLSLLNAVQAVNIRDGSHALSEKIHAHLPIIPSLFNLDTPSNLTRRQSATTQCGTTGNGASCPASQCCSTYGFCGTDPNYCDPVAGCQPQYGFCGTGAPPAGTSSSAVPPTSSSTSAPAPPSSSSTTVPTSSSSVVVPSSSPPSPSPTLTISTNGMCGNSTTCAGSTFGRCCSPYFYCGNGDAYCGTGCQSLFGSCGGGSASSSSVVPVPPSSSSTAAPPPPTSSSTVAPPPPASTSSATGPAPTPGGPVSTNGTCGNGITCTGSTFGRCCSEYGFCGSSADYCRTLFGCQAQYGSCDP